MAGLNYVASPLLRKRQLLYQKIHNVIIIPTKCGARGIDSSIEEYGVLIYWIIRVGKILSKSCTMFKNYTLNIIKHTNTYYTVCRHTNTN